ncbi:MAG: hypothetical protein IPL96_12535 [Holophagaceae bacterium]|nr:hypothetical protein [Holophagaceae bacterium]
MAKREPVRPSPKLLALLKDFQQIAGMAGYLTSAMDAPQLRLMFTLFARIMAPTEEAARARVADLQAWCDRIGVDLREGSSSAVLPPQVLIANPQAAPSGMWLLVATMNFNTKITDSSYQRVRTAVLKAYQRAVVLREKGLDVALHLLETPESWEAVITAEIPLLLEAGPDQDDPEPAAPEGEPAAAEADGLEVPDPPATGA